MPVLHNVRSPTSVKIFDGTTKFTCKDRTQRIRNKRSSDDRQRFIFSDLTRNARRHNMEERLSKKPTKTVDQPP